MLKERKEFVPICEELVPLKDFSPDPEYKDNMAEEFTAATKE